MKMEFEWPGAEGESVMAYTIFFSHFLFLFDKYLIRILLLLLTSIRIYNSSNYIIGNNLRKV